jgi:hypothetical protein
MLWPMVRGSGWPSRWCSHRCSPRSALRRHQTSDMRRKRPPYVPSNGTCPYAGACSVRADRATPCRTDRSQLAKLANGHAVGHARRAVMGGSSLDVQAAECRGQSRARRRIGESTSAHPAWTSAAGLSGHGKHVGPGHGNQDRSRRDGVQAGDLDRRLAHGSLIVPSSSTFKSRLVKHTKCPMRHWEARVRVRSRPVTSSAVRSPGKPPGDLDRQAAWKPHRALPGHQAAR